MHIEPLVHHQFAVENNFSVKKSIFCFGIPIWMSTKKSTFSFFYMYKRLGKDCFIFSEYL